MLNGNNTDRVYNGKKMLELSNGRCKPLSFGLGKAVMILESIPDIEQYVKEERGKLSQQPTAQKQITNTEELIKRAVREEIQKIIAGS